ncbi:hypothetical protein M9Y10_000801 [Tritrichomonas musculus]|uniref:Ubiquitin-like domain-containing protein n=1 Tax=Tritrichomonas musculus TaxID=1915356 RepID=A0ABR2L572_9EUKA
MSFIDVEVESNVVSPYNSRYHVYVGEKIGTLLDKIDFEQLGSNLDPSVAVLKFHGKVLDRNTTFEYNNIVENDVLELTIQEP